MRFIDPPILKQRDANQTDWWGAVLFFFCVAYVVTFLGLLAKLAGIFAGKIFWPCLQGVLLFLEWTASKDND
ncbi:MAG: hypothetical protein QF752_08350 [Planctomycetota bacterium]|jgi:hypothetical protein|nr:hypothetical protein [Planctomycetota bacterium]